MVSEVCDMELPQNKQDINNEAINKNKWGGKWFHNKWFLVTIHKFTFFRFNCQVLIRYFAVWGWSS